MITTEIARPNNIRGFIRFLLLGALPRIGPANEWRPIFSLLQASQTAAAFRRGRKPASQRTHRPRDLLPKNFCRARNPIIGSGNNHRR